jgi:hypothetical protein
MPIRIVRTFIEILLVTPLIAASRAEIAPKRGGETIAGILTVILSI